MGTDKKLVSMGILWKSASDNNNQWNIEQMWKTTAVWAHLICSGSMKLCSGSCIDRQIFKCFSE